MSKKIAKKGTSSTSRRALINSVIAESKLVKEVAKKNAEIALLEAFQPQLQRVISSRLAEEEEGDEEFAPEGEEVPATGGEELPAEDQFAGEESFDDEEPVEEGDEFGDEVPTGDEELSLDGEDTSLTGEEEPVEEGDEELGDEFGGEEAPIEGEDDDSDLDLESIIRELESDIEGETSEEPIIGDEEEEVPVAEIADSSAIGTGDNKQPATAASDDSTPDPGANQLFEEEEPTEDEELTLQEILAALNEEEGESVEQTPTETEDAYKEISELKSALREAKSELKDAYKALSFVRKQMNEVHSLNAKLLFMNKLFKKYSLSERQKIKIVEAFDHATTQREIKLVFATLAESLKGVKPATQRQQKTLSEAFNRSASNRVQRSTRPNKDTIVEANDFASRMQELAGIKKKS